MASDSEPKMKSGLKRAENQGNTATSRTGPAQDSRKGPWTFVLDDPLQRAHQFAKTLKEGLTNAMVGQTEARAALAAFAFQVILGCNHNGPCQRALLLGPSGSGKSLAARIFAQLWMDQLDNPGEGGLLELDLSRYTEWSSAADLFGDKSRPGAVGSFLSDHPAGVLLANGFEQAHQNVLNALPAILDGELRVAPNGKVIDFSRAIWLFSSTEGKAVWGRTGTAHTEFSLDLSAVLNSPKTDRWGERQPDQVPGELIVRLAQGPLVLFRLPLGHHHFDLFVRTCTSTWS